MVVVKEEVLTVQLKHLLRVVNMIKPAVLLLVVSYFIYIYSISDKIRLTHEIVRCVAKIPILEKIEGGTYDYISTLKHIKVLASIHMRIYDTISSDHDTNKYEWKSYDNTTWMINSKDFSYGFHGVVDDIIKPILEPNMKISPVYSNSHIYILIHTRHVLVWTRSMRQNVNHPTIVTK